LWRQCCSNNAEKIDLTGEKWSDKVYVRHTGYPGGQRFTTAEALLKKNPIGLVEKAVKGMLPKNRLGSALSEICMFMQEVNIHMKHRNLKKLNFKIF